MNEDNLVLPPFIKITDDPYGIYPGRTLRKIWEWAIFSLSLLILCEIPFDWIFQPSLTASYVFPSLLIDLIYLVDIFIIFKTGIPAYGIIKTDKKSIHESISLWRKITLWMSPWPFYTIGYFLKNKLVFNILVTIKILRLIRLYESFNLMWNSLLYSNSKSKIIILFLILIVISHYFACLLWYVGNQESSGNSWLHLSGIDQKTKGYQYLYTLYYTITTIATIGFGDIVPVTYTEMLIILFVEFIGVFYYNFVISILISILTNPTKTAFINNFSRIMKSLKYLHISPKFISNVRLYYEYLWERDRNRAGTYDSISKMPISLQYRIKMALHMNLFTNLENFQLSDEKILKGISMALKPKIFSPGDVLLKAGIVADRILFLTQGTIQAISMEGQVIDEFNGSNNVIFGEYSMTNFTEHPVNLVAQSYSEAFELTKVDYLQIINSNQI